MKILVFITSVLSFLKALINRNQKKKDVVKIVFPLTQKKVMTKQTTYTKIETTTIEGF